MMRERLVLLTPVATDDGQGGRSVTFQTLATVPAEMAPLSASERIQAAQLNPNTLYRFRIRVRPDVTTVLRLLWTPTWPPGAVRKTLQVIGVLPDSDGRQWQRIDAVEVQA